MTTQLQVKLASMTKQDLLAFIEAQAKATSNGVQVKKNASGGVYIRSSKFIEFSTRTNKDYVAGLNIPFNTAKALFNDEALLVLIRDQINAM